MVCLVRMSPADLEHEDKHRNKYRKACIDHGSICVVFVLCKKPEDPQFEPHVRIKMEQVVGSPLYICDSTRNV